MTADGLTSVQPQFVGSLGTYLAEAPLFASADYDAFLCLVSAGSSSSRLSRAEKISAPADMGWIPSAKCSSSSHANALTNPKPFALQRPATCVTNASSMTCG